MESFFFFCTDRPKPSCKGPSLVWAAVKSTCGNCVRALSFCVATNAVPAKRNQLSLNLHRQLSRWYTYRQSCEEKQATRLVWLHLYSAPQDTMPTHMVTMIRTYKRKKYNIHFIITHIILAFWLLYAYDLLEDRCMIDVIITKFFFCDLKWQKVLRI